MCGSFSSLGGSHLQAFLAIQPINPLRVHLPPLAAQQHRMRRYPYRTRLPASSRMRMRNSVLRIAPALIAVDPTRDPNQPTSTVFVQLVALAYADSPVLAGAAGLRPFLRAPPAEYVCRASGLRPASSVCGSLPVTAAAPAARSNPSRQSAVSSYKTPAVKPPIPGKCH